MNGQSWREVGESILAGGAMLICIVFSPILRLWYNRWGATHQEILRSFPGDERVPQPRLGYTRAVTIRASPAQIWPWLVQLGQERAGLYSYELLENLIGCRMHNADVIVPEWQHLSVGDTIRLGPKGYPVYKVVALANEQTIVVAGADPVTEEVMLLTTPMPPSYVNYSWCFQLVPLGDGTTRLITRVRLDYAPGSFGNWFVWRFLMEPINFVMERKTLLSIKARAEGTIVQKMRRTAMQLALY